MLETLLALALLFPVNLVVPGFLLTRRSRQTGEVRLLLVLSLSLLTLFLVSFLLYLFNAPRFCFPLFSALLCCAVVPLRGEVRSFFGAAPIRRLLRHYAIFLGCMLLLALLIRNYSGGGWAGDWKEHYQRSLFFLEHAPLDTVFINEWTLTARPPLFNLVAAYFLHHVGRDFLHYQLTAILLNSLVFFGAWGGMHAIGRSRGQAARPAALLVLTLLLALNPSVAENGTLVWTRALTNFFILSGLALYLLALSAQQPSLRRYAWLNLGLAAVTHYSAAPYLIGMALVDFYLLLRKRLVFSDAAGDLAVAAAPPLLWLAFALYHYGWQGALLANSTAASALSMGLGETLVKTWGNLLATIVPHPLRWGDASAFPPLAQLLRLPGESIRNYFFLIYQVNIFFMIGSAGGIAALCLFVRDVLHRSAAGQRESTLLLLGYLGFVLAVGIALHGPADYYGVGHICLQPLAIVGVVYLATRFPVTGPLVKVAVVAGLALDCLLGIALHFRFQHYTAAEILAFDRYEELFSPTIIFNATHKAEMGYLYLGDLRFAWGAGLALLVVLGVLLQRAVSAQRRATARSKGSATEA